MARKSKEAKLAEIHAEAIREFDDIQAASRDVRLQCLQDRRFVFVPGAQWEGGLGEQFEFKPKYEFNKVHLACIRIFNEYRNNRITVDFQPRDGSKDDKLADACDGMYRADEKACSADEAYDNTFDEGTAGGMGALRLRAVCEDDDDDENEHQRIAMEPIFDADSCVFYDLGAKRYDKADAKRCYVLTPYAPSAYKDEFGDDPADWPHTITQAQFDWCTPDVVWVCELYRVEEEKETVVIFQGLAGDEKRVELEELEEDPTLAEELQATGYVETERKKVRCRKVVKYLMNGAKMLNEGEEIAGKLIPVIPYYGKRMVVDGVERYQGHVRLAKDAQRLVNMLLSWLADMAARFDIEKPILTPEQIGEHAWMWAEDSVQRYPYLLTNSLLDVQTGNPIPGSNVPLGYTKAPNIPPAMAALAQMASQALEDMLGNQQAGEQVQPNVSGKVIELVQTRLDMQVFIYMSNFAKTVKRCGEVWLSMMKDISCEENRKRKTIGPNGEVGAVVLNKPGYDPETGTDIVENDMANCSYEVDVEVGPSSSSKRTATVRQLTAMKQGTTDPETIQVLDNLILMNMEGEGITDARDWARRRMIKMGVVKPNEEELAQLQAEQAGAQPSPQDQYLTAAAEQAQADAGAARAKTVQTVADADLKRAQTAKTLAETASARNAQMLASAEALQKMLAPPQQTAPMF